MDESDYLSASNDYAWFLQPNRESNPAIRFRFGGLRREFFGEYCGLTNHRLVKNSKDIWIYNHPHCSPYVTCADFAPLLRHDPRLTARLRGNGRQSRETSPLPPR